MATPSPSLPATHTPLPWSIGHQLGDGFSVVHEIAPNCGLLVCLATFHNIGGHAFHGQPLNDDVAKANRDFVLKACNEHAAIRAALADLVAQIPLGALNVRKEFSLMVAHAAAVKALQS